jgi:hypothetical protein
VIFLLGQHTTPEYLFTNELIRSGLLSRWFPEFFEAFGGFELVKPVKANRLHHAAVDDSVEASSFSPVLFVSAVIQLIVVIS